MRRLPLFLFCALLVACQPPAADPGPVQEAGEGGTVLVTEDDPEMTTAIEQARATLDEAIAAMHQRGTGDELAMKRLKKRKLALKDTISRIEDELTPDIIA